MYIGCIRVTNNDIPPMPRFPYVNVPTPPGETPVREQREVRLRGVSLV